MENEIDDWEPLNGKFWGVFMNNGSATFWISNANFKILAEIQNCFSNSNGKYTGHFNDNVKNVAKKHNVDLTNYSRMRTEKTIEDVERVIKISRSLLTK